MDKIIRHEAICKELTSIYEAKNKDYGDSFDKSFEVYGMSMPCIRLNDKLNRLVAISKANGVIAVNNESVIDTLLDLANYSIMTIMAIQDNKSSLSKAFKDINKFEKEV